jgi:hypothetical protein
MQLKMCKTHLWFKRDGESEGLQRRRARKKVKLNERST